MTESKQKPKVRIGKKEKTAILNYGLIKEQIKTLTKQKDLLKDEILPYFEKTNAIMLTGLGIIWECFGCAGVSCYNHGHNHGYDHGYNHGYISLM